MVLSFKIATLERVVKMSLVAECVCGDCKFRSIMGCNFVVARRPGFRKRRETHNPDLIAL